MTERWSGSAEHGGGLEMGKKKEKESKEKKKKT